jgi:predicted carbohydrate-binding protein with CBM5 and CBM33 domain
MKLKMTKIVDYGTHASEKVLIDVLEKANLKYYIVRDTTFSNKDTISNKWTHVHKFLNQVVNKGDKVVLYTKNGTNTKKELANGSIEYTYYWGLGSSVWNNDGDAAVLYEINNWQTLGVNSSK